MQRAILDAHHQAIAVTLGLIERDVARTRTGHAGATRVPVRGLIAAGFDHHDSRVGDPQLHTHLVVSNRAQAADGNWRTLDSQSLYAAAVAHSDTYDLLLADNLPPQAGGAPSAHWVWRGRPGSAAGTATRAASWPPCPTI